MDDSQDSQRPRGQKSAESISDVPEFLKAGKNRQLVTLTVAGRVYRLDKDRIVLGSVESADVRLVGDGVSPIHAVLEARGAGGKPTIYDLASETGVFVNGSKTITQELKAGDEITLGRHKLRFGIDALEAARAGERKLYRDPQEDIAPLILVESEDGRPIEEIFDYRPTSKQALEVVMSWHGTILDIEHFTRERDVTIGNERKSDFGIPPLLSKGSYAIVTRRGQGFELNLDARMSGVLQRQGKLERLEEGHARVIPLDKDDFAKVSVGEVDFYLSYTTAPPRLKRRRLLDRDPFMARVMFVSLLLTAVTITALLRMKVPPALEAEQIPERIATIIYQPPTPPPAVKKDEKKEPRATPKPEPTQKQAPKPKPEPKHTTRVEVKPEARPIPVPKHLETRHEKPKPHATAKPAPHPKPKATHAAQAPKRPSGGAAHEGEGARAKGHEGAAGSRHAPKAEHHQSTASRPSPTGGKGHGGGHSQVVDNGNVDLVKGAQARIENILGNSGSLLGKSGSKLKGFGGFESEGEGGLALSGHGRGGGGSAETLAGGLGNKGSGGGAVGTGRGAFGKGSGAGIAGGLGRVAIRTGGPEEQIVMGSIDPGAIAAAIAAHRDEFRACYEKEINAEHPNLSGTIVTDFVIGSSGHVTHAAVDSSTLKSPAVEGCVLKVIRRIEFPIPTGGGVVEARFPFKFNSLSK